MVDDSTPLLIETLYYFFIFIFTGDDDLETNFYGLDDFNGDLDLGGKIR